MSLRPTMAPLIQRVRLLINDPNPNFTDTVVQFSDLEIQEVMDESRLDVVNGTLTAKPTFSGTSITFLDYYSDLGGWEEGAVLKQFLTRTVTPSISEPIVGHWQFAQTTLPPIYVTGALHDVYRSAADLLERWSARWVLRYNVTTDGQSAQRSQASTALLNLANKYRMKQRAQSIAIMRTDTRQPSGLAGAAGPLEIDYMSSGQKGS